MLGNPSEGTMDAVSGALTVRQVAERLNVNERTVYRMAQTADIPAFKVAGTWRVLPADLNTWINKQKAIASGDQPKGNR